VWRARRCLRPEGFEHAPPTFVMDGVNELVEALRIAWLRPPGSWHFRAPHVADGQPDRESTAIRRLVGLRDGRLNPPGLPVADLSKRVLANRRYERPT
jgi:hypothetical protein